MSAGIGTSRYRCQSNFDLIHIPNPLEEPWPHKASWHLLNYMCQLFYDHLINKKSSNLNLSLVSEQHNYAIRSVSLQHLNPESFRINIRKFCPTIIGCYYWNDIPISIRSRPTNKLFKKALRQFYLAQY